MKMEKLFWLDMEMSGLDPVQNRILEVAVIITDLELNTLKTFETAVYQPPEVLTAMDAWCTEHHGKSGLTARVPEGLAETEVETVLLRLANEQMGNERVILCGNSISQDRKFVEMYFKQFDKKLHYRMLDVSSFKLIFEHKYKQKFKKENKHRALDDIKESIAEFKFYLNFISVPEIVKG